MTPRDRFRTTVRPRAGGIAPDLSDRSGRDLLVASTLVAALLTGTVGVAWAWVALDPATIAAALTGAVLGLTGRRLGARLRRVARRHREHCRRAADRSDVTHRETT